jgi:amino acid transporter
MSGRKEESEMFGRRFGRDDAPADDRRGGVATATRDGDVDGDGIADRDRGVDRDGDRYADGNGNGGAVATRERRTGTGRAAAGAVVLDREARLRQRDAFGGFNWGAAFFGWLVAIGMGVILTAIIGAAGAAIGLTNNPSKSDAGTIGIIGGALLIAIAVIAYYCGGYVAGRMSRFDGARQGFGTWALGLLITLLIAAAGAIFGDQYNVFESLNLPRIPVSTSDLTTGGAIALAAIFFGSLLAAIVGGKAGERYHRRVDRAAVR